MNASDANVSAAPPGAPPARLETPVMSGGFTMAETTAIAMLASSAIGAILGLIVVTCVLVAVTKQLARLVRVLRGEASVHTGLLASSVPPPDAFAGPANGGAAPPNAMLNSKSILKKPIARVPAKKSRLPKTDENNTSCAIAEVDEEEDHTL